MRAHLLTHTNKDDTHIAHTYTDILAYTHAWTHKDKRKTHTRTNTHILTHTHTKYTQTQTITQMSTHTQAVAEGGVRRRHDESQFPSRVHTKRITCMHIT